MNSDQICGFLLICIILFEFSFSLTPWKQQKYGKHLKKRFISEQKCLVMSVCFWHRNILMSYVCLTTHLFLNHKLTGFCHTHSHLFMWKQNQNHLHSALDQKKPSCQKCSYWLLFISRLLLPAAFPPHLLELLVTDGLDSVCFMKPLMIYGQTVFGDDGRTVWCVSTHTSSSEMFPAAKRLTKNHQDSCQVSETAADGVWNTETEVAGEPQRDTGEDVQVKKTETNGTNHGGNVASGGSHAPQN